MKIIVDGEVKYSDWALKNGKIIKKQTSADICTEIYLEHNGVYFPHYKWTDLTDSVIGMWMHHLSVNVDVKDVNFTMYFMDGSYRLDIFKDNNMHMTVNCVSSNTREENVDLTFQCDYIEFLQALYEANKSLNYLLYKNDLVDGRFKSVYNQTIITKNELKQLIKKLRTQGDDSVV